MQRLVKRPLRSACIAFFMPQLTMPVLVFDLDDTLYPELSYVHSGFRAVAAFLSPLLGVPAETLAAGMIAEEAAQGRGQVFDNVLRQHGRWSKTLVAACLRAYRQHRPALGFVPGCRALPYALCPPAALHRDRWPQGSAGPQSGRAGPGRPGAPRLPHQPLRPPPRQARPARFPADLPARGRGARGSDCTWATTSQRLRGHQAAGVSTRCGFCGETMRIMRPMPRTRLTEALSRWMS